MEGLQKLQTATLAGGCFWCTEAIFKRLKGVESVMPGYSGGNTENPTYENLHNQNTGHAEAIQIIFDPDIISYQKLLEVFFHLHDPTTLNRQGNDMGQEYRSVIFYHDSKQREVAEKVKEEIEKSGMYHDPIVTKIEPFKIFYKAEENHQNYFERNTDAPYCRFVIDPKIKKLYKEFKEDVKENTESR